MSRDGVTPEVRRAQHQQRVEAAYVVLNRAEHEPLGVRLEAVATVLRHGTAGMNEKAAIDRMAQGVAFIAEALAKTYAS